MDAEEFDLIEPAEAMADEFIAYSEEFRAAGEPFVLGELDQVKGDFARLLGIWRDRAAGRNLPEGRVPYNVYWLVRGGRILGTIRLRHRLNQQLSHEGGHVGFDVRPSERGKGCATRMLAEVLQMARQRGLSRVLVTCDKDNAASARVIQKNGGELEDEVVAKRRDGSEKLVQRYWIDL